MSFWKNLFGSSGNNKNLPMQEPEHEIMQAPPDDLMVTDDKQSDQNITKEDSLNNKDSP